MLLKHIYCSAAVLLTFVALGCGGSGGGTSSTASSTFAIEGAISSPAVSVDPLNIQVGDTVQFKLVGTNTTTNRRVTFPVSDWHTDAPSSIATVTSAGVLTAVASTGTSTYHIIGGGISSVLAITAGQASVTGLIRLADLTTYDRINVYFYDQKSGNFVGSAVTGTDGTFRALLPTKATHFTVDTSLVDPHGLYFYQEFSYDPSGSGTFYTYTMKSNDCSAALPPLTLGISTPLLDAVVLTPVSGTTPPPPPTGCSLP